MTTPAVLRAHAEQQFAHELDALARADDRPRPPSWRMSPWAVATYLLGGRLDDGTEIVPKYIGDRRRIEIAVATLATDRALLLMGVPGTAKSWVSEHLAAAISGDSTLLIQGTAGTSEEQIRYGWNYARLLADGPSRAAIVASPMMRGMADGKITRVEELTRIFRELRAGVTEDGKSKLKSPSGTLSPAEAISVVSHGLALAAHFGDGTLRAADLAGGIQGAVVKDPVQDRAVWLEYLETVVRERDGWKDLYRAGRENAA